MWLSQVHAVRAETRFESFLSPHILGVEDLHLFVQTPLKSGALYIRRRRHSQRGNRPPEKSQENHSANNTLIPSFLLSFFSVNTWTKYRRILYCPFKQLVTKSEIQSFCTCSYWRFVFLQYFDQTKDSELHSVTFYIEVEDV